MDSPRIDIVTQFPPETTSLKNLYQSVDRANESWDVHVNRFQGPEVPGQNKVSSALRSGLLTLQTLGTRARLRWQTDLLIIHKPLRGELVERLFGIHLAERAFLSFDPVVYATFDANYVDNPEKCSLLFTQSDLVYATSGAIEQEVKKHTSPERIAFIPPSVDTELFKPEPSSSQQIDDGHDLVLGWVGYVEGYEENLWLLVDALDTVDTDGVTLRFLNGGGQFPAELKQGIEATGVTLEIIDAVPHDSVPEVINSFDVGVAPLRDTKFNRGRSSEKIREYMACGVPVIASAVGENPSLVPDDAGFVVEEPQDWQSAVQTLSDPQVRSEMGRNAREHVVEHYSIRAVGQQVQSAFQDLLDV